MSAFNKSGRYLNTKGSGRSVSDFALVHSSEGAFTRSQTRVNGEMVIKLRLNNGGHSQKGMELLDKYGIKYNIVKTYPNGVRVGVKRTHGKIATVFPDSDQSSVTRRKNK